MLTRLRRSDAKTLNGLASWIDDSDQEAPRTIFRGVGGAGALKTAVDKAFEGIDWEEFTAAWIKATKRGK